MKILLSMAVTDMDVYLQDYSIPYLLQKLILGIWKKGLLIWWRGTIWLDAQDFGAYMAWLLWVSVAQLFTCIKKRGGVLDVFDSNTFGVFRIPSVALKHATLALLPSTTPHYHFQNLVFSSTSLWITKFLSTLRSTPYHCSAIANKCKNKNWYLIVQEIFNLDFRDTQGTSSFLVYVIVCEISYSTISTLAYVW